MIKNFLIPIFVFLLTGCENKLQELQQIGALPKFSETKIPEIEQQDIAYKTENNNKSKFINSYMSTIQHDISNKKHLNNSLWKKGRKSFFKDQRASQVGDILTVVIDVKDQQAKLYASAKVSGKHNDSTEAIRTLLRAVLPSKSLTNLALGEKVSISNDAEENKINSEIRNSLYKGLVPEKSYLETESNYIERGSDTLKFNIASMIKYELPNGNFYIEGRQELRVDSELREITLSGIIRGEDIASDNTVAYDKIAEARISYGGKGAMARKQSQKYGSEFLDIISPF